MVYGMPIVIGSRVDLYVYLFFVESEVSTNCNLSDRYGENHFSFQFSPGFVVVKCTARNQLLIKNLYTSVIAVTVDLFVLNPC